MEYFHIHEGNDFVDSMGGNLKDNAGIDAQQDHPRRIGVQLAGRMRPPYMQGALFYLERN